jgi:signal transduction histidine kinase
MPSDTLRELRPDLGSSQEATTPDLPQRGVLDAERLNRGLDQIVEGSARLAELTDDLLDVARLQTGHFTMHQQRLDLVAISRALLDRYAEQVSERYSLAFRSDATVCEVAADPSRIEQVVTNLVGNALKYSPDGGVIEVRLAPHDSGVLLEVTDQGIGLPPGSEEVIFRPFGRAANAGERQIEGLGLGLYICRKIAEQHGGWIRAQSDGIDKGTTMRVWLPCAEGEPLS